MVYWVHWLVWRIFSWGVISRELTAHDLAVCLSLVFFSAQASTRQTNSQCGNLGMSLSEVSWGKDSLHLKHIHIHTTLLLPVPPPTLATFNLISYSRMTERHLLPVFEVYKKSASGVFRTSGPCVPSAARTQSRPWQPSGFSSENEEPPPERTRSSHASKTTEKRMKGKLL